jgi:CheY-like chemotaxis protein
MTKILLVEDDKSLREIYGVRLQAEGYEIVSAGDGEEALAIAIKERPGLIVSDVMMPKISGFDMLDILRSTTETKDIKVIMMTALSSDDQRARGESLGADRYLVKSQVGIEDVVRTVHEVLGDGVPGAAPATPSFPPVATPAPVEPPVTAPVASVVPEPVAIPVPEPVAVPPTPVAPAPVELAPVINTPPAPAPIPMPEPLAPAMPPEQPAAVPSPVEMPAPVVPEPVPMPTPEPIAPPAPQAPPAATLPEPTAPFSSPAPASLGDRVINPLPSAESLQQAPNDIAAQMNQELAGSSTPPASTPPPPPPPMPPVPPAPAV